LDGADVGTEVGAHVMPIMFMSSLQSSCRRRSCRCRGVSQKDPLGCTATIGSLLTTAVLPECCWLCWLSGICRPGAACTDP
jgi:hypothetical protein